ncbi:hypothetical protein CRG98_019651 [Punica granatum]|uniref:Uncharacterized protein n=1 Tax=Punica granatum TaxID=22663 RepID=A0A2I0JUG3_PUNGR|nr:hypothetical protein CRG98_019651 [Punica granatum]
MDKNDPLVPHTSCRLGILNGSGQIIYSNMILDQPSNTAQPSSAKDSSSSTMGKPSMPSKQFGITSTTDEPRKRGQSMTAQAAELAFGKAQSFLSSKAGFRQPNRTVRVDPTTLGTNDHHGHLEGSLGYPRPLTLPQNSIGSLRGDVRPDLCQSGILLKPGHPRTLIDAFSNRAPRRPIHEQINGTRKQACTHPRTTRTKEQVSDCLSEFVLVSQVDLDLEKGPIFAQKRGQRPF